MQKDNEKLLEKVKEQIEALEIAVDIDEIFILSHEDNHLSRVKKEDIENE